MNDLGVADHIEPGSPQSAAQLATATGADERSLYRVLRFLASHGLFEETGQHSFDHTALSARLRSDADNSYRPAVQMFNEIFSAWDGLQHSMMTGEPGFKKVFGAPLFDYLGQNPELAAIFDAGMTAIHGHETAAMLDAYNFKDVGVLADIGGGNGTLIASALKRYPDMRGILFDLGHVAGRAREMLTRLEVDERCTIVEGDFFESIAEGADTYLFRHIIHDWTDEQSVRILRNCRKVMPDDGRLLIVEFVVPPGNEPSLAKEADITMLVFPGGMERTEEEYGVLFEQSGFRLASVTPTAASVSVVEGRPA